MSQIPGVPAPETALEAWLRQLTISLWFRTSGQEESLALADQWFNRVQAAVGESLADFDAHDGSQIERFVSRGVPNSFRVTSRGVPLTTQFSQMRRPSPNLVGGSACWTVRAVKSIEINFSLRAVPCDEGEHPDGQEILLDCTLWHLPDVSAKRSTTSRITSVSRMP
ncbi:MAG: hypothetical protein ABI112_09795 [Terracoccus sp.]